MPWDILGQFFLTFSHDTFLIPFIILGSIWGKRDVFYGATCLILLSMIFNLCLKLTFQVPLSPALGKAGFAFPSGHMQSSTIFYGWILYQIPSQILRVSLFLLLGAIGVSLVYFGYHTYYDILGAIFFAILLMVGYQKINLKLKKPFNTLGILLLATLELFYISYKSPQIPFYTWMAYYALTGFVVFSSFFLKDEDFSLKKSQKLLITLLCFGFIFLFYTLFQRPFFFQMPLYINQLHWLFIGMSLPFSQRLILSLKKG